MIGPNFSKLLARKGLPSKIVIASVLVLIAFMLPRALPGAKAQADFDKMKAAANHCMQNMETGCTEFANLSGKKTQQQLAEEGFGVQDDYSAEGFDPMQFLTTWNFNNLPPQERSKYYKETIIGNQTLREYWIYAEDKLIEIAPGIFFNAWTYNGQVPAPTIRVTEGDLVRIYFTNKGTKPHTMHFHGFHNSSMDGSMPEDYVYPGQNFTYEFTADPYGVHLYHCHSTPLKEHISKGLYGAYIVNPKNDTKPKPSKELVMVMNGFDTNNDGQNDVYAVNTKAFYYALHPIKVKKGELVRIYLVNVLESDPINSFHIHAAFFDEYRTGTKMQPDAYTDTVSFAQGERSILDVKFKYPGMYMFHAHQTEFTELGWMGFFEVT